MLESVISKHFKFHDHKYESKKNTLYLAKKRQSINNTFDQQSSRDQSFGYFNSQLKYCAVDYYDVAPPKYPQKGYSTPVRKLKKSPKRNLSYHFHSEQKPNCQIMKFEGYISRDSPFRNWIGNINKPEAHRVSQLQRINNQVKNIEKNQKSESYQLQEYLNAVHHRIEWNSLPKVFDYQRCQTPDILKDARVRVRRF